MGVDARAFHNIQFPPLKFQVKSFRHSGLQWFLSIPNDIYKSIGAYTTMNTVRKRIRPIYMIWCIILVSWLA